MSNLLLMNVSGGAAAPSELDAGYYFQTGLSSPPPDPTPGNGWTLTTKFDDVGVDDETTYEEGDGDGRIMCLIVLAASASRSGYTAKIWQEVPGVYITYYWDGAAWVQWGTPILGGNLSHQWSASSETPGAQSSKYFCLVFDDDAVVDLPPAVRIGDWRLS